MPTTDPTPTNPTIAADETPVPGPIAVSDFRTAINDYMGGVEDKVQAATAFLEKLSNALGDGWLTGGTIAAGTGLSVDIAALTAFVGTYVNVTTTTTVGSLANGATNYLYLYQDGTFTSNTTGVTPSSSGGNGQAMLWGTATTSGGAVTSVSNARTSALSLVAITANQKIASIAAVFDGGGSALTSGAKVRVSVPYDCTITGATVLLDQSGSVAVEVRKCTYAQYDAGGTHPVTGDKISASAPPTVTAATKSTDTTLTGWVTSVAANDILEFYLSSAATATWASVTLSVTKG